jgi:hypothetical protein
VTFFALHQALFARSESEAKVKKKSSRIEVLLVTLINFNSSHSLIYAEYIFEANQK